MAPEPITDAAKAEFQSKTTEVSTKTSESVTKYNELVGKINSALSAASWATKNIWFLNDEIDRLIELGNKATGQINKWSEELFKIVRGSVPVLSLYDAAIRWSRDIQSPVSATSGIVGAPATLAMRGQWEGPASLAYYTVVLPGQQGAVNGITAMASGTSKWLAEVASSNLDFMIKILVPVLEVLEKVIAGLAAGATIAGLLEAIGRIADALGESISAIFKICTETAAKIGKTIEQANAALNLANDNTAFPNRKWPDPVTI
jgi:hypothetical protein